MTARVLRGYEGAAAAWASGPERVYAAIADAVLPEALGDVRGATVLDLGAGTGVASRTVAAAGGRPVACDAAVDMLSWRRGERPPSAAGDALALPFRADVFDATVAAFVFNHVADVSTAFAEATRVTRPGGVVVATVYAASNDHPAKAAVEAAAARYGHERPEWYEAMKGQVEPTLSTTTAADGHARRAGLVDVVAVERVVATGIRTPDALVAWRLGMPHVYAFVSRLAPDERQRLRRDALAAVGSDPVAYEAIVIVVRGVVPPA